jgi:hypothetical protein
VKNKETALANNLTCPRFQLSHIKKNIRICYGKQNHRSKSCGRQACRKLATDPQGKTIVGQEIIALEGLKLEFKVTESCASNKGGLRQFLLCHTNKGFPHIQTYSFDCLLLIFRKCFIY